MPATESRFVIERITPAGDGALVVEFELVISREINAQVRALDRAIAAAQWPDVLASVPAYRSLLIYYDSGMSPFADLERRIRNLSGITDSAQRKARRWQIPVCYALGDSGDLQHLSETLGMAVPDIIALHGEPEYLVYMIGFSPGFAYLGELPPGLEIRRKEAPAPSVPANSIQIGGSQTALSSMPMPSGWFIVGRTPVPMYLPDRERPFLIEGGDRVQFEAICAETFRSLAAEYITKRTEPAWEWVD